MDVPKGNKMRQDEWKEWVSRSEKEEKVRGRFESGELGGDVVDDAGKGEFGAFQPSLRGL